MLAGKTDFNGNSDIAVLGTDLEGELLWTRVLGEIGNEEVESMITTSEGKVIIAGLTTSFTPGNSIILFKLEATGLLLWTKWLQAPSQAQSHHVTPTNDGGFISTGFRHNPLTGGRDIQVIKFDSSGNIPWEGLHGGSAADYSQKVHITEEGDYVVCGSSASYGSGLI